MLTASVSVSLSFSPLHASFRYVPDVGSIELTSDDQYVIVGCDGLWDLISNDDAVRIVGAEERPEVRAPRISVSMTVMPATPEPAATAGPPLRR